MGEEQLGKISGYVFEDYNANGVMDKGEPGIFNQRVFLEIKGSSDYNQSLQSAWTDQKGWYIFLGLRPSLYRVRVEVGLDQSQTTTADDEGVYQMFMYGPYHFMHRDFGMHTTGVIAPEPVVPASTTESRAEETMPEPMWDVLFEESADDGTKDVSRGNGAPESESRLTNPAAFEQADEAGSTRGGGMLAALVDASIRWKEALMLAMALAAGAGLHASTRDKRAKRLDSDACFTKAC
jgi:hypothetical protein